MSEYRTVLCLTPPNPLLGGVPSLRGGVGSLPYPACCLQPSRSGWVRCQSSSLKLGLFPDVLGFSVGQASCLPVEARASKMLVLLS